MTSPAMEVRNLTKSYGAVKAVDNIDFQVEAGELVGFLGLNGAGKTTTMRILTTFMPASSGYAFVAGYDVMYQSMEVRQKLGYLPESVPIYPEMRVEEYLDDAGQTEGDRPHETRFAHRLLSSSAAGSSKCAAGSSARFSKGYRQRVGLADALLADPLVLDPRRTAVRPRPDPAGGDARTPSAGSRGSTRCSSAATN